MDVTMFLFLVATLPGFLAGQDMHFTGGSMSFKFINTTNTPYKIRITAVTGWVLGMGPCGTSCSRNDIGRKTAASRRQFIKVKGETYFGTWSTEVGVRSKEKKYATITPYVNKNINEHVAAVNIPMRWEQDTAYFDLDIDPTCMYTDVSVHGSYWREFNYTYGVNNYPVNYRLQIKVKPAPREDTHEPNNSPVAIFQPVYKIKLNEATTIRLSTFDSDGDFVRCLYAEFVEAGGLTNLNNTVVNKDCSIVLNPQESDGFVDGGWGAIPVKVIDTPSKPKIDTAVSYESEILSSINVQFMIQTLAKMDAPQFVDPTLESQHEFTVYVGSTLKIPLYAKPMEFSVIEIDSFYMRSIPTRIFHLDPIRDDPTRTAERVKYSTVQWRPDESDVGEYVISALVTDTEGSDGLDRNYHIVVKDMDFLPAMQPLHKGPYFPLFPSINGVVCMINSTCSFPIYTNTDTTGDSVVSLNYTTSTFPQTTISQPSPVTKDGKSMFVSDVHVHPSISGEQRICFEATDSKGMISNNRCLGVHVQLPDPCKSSPCVNGLCRSEAQSYVCSCGPSYTGRHCESDIDFCASRPCLNNGSCSRTLTRYKCDCAGTGHVGKNCEIGTIDCKLGVCGVHGVCKDLDEKFECDCFSGYSGHQCQTIDNKCQGVSCRNDGICIVEEGKGVCKCPLGYSGTECENSNFASTVNSGTSGTKYNPFTVPSMPNGAEVECPVNRDCVIAVYSKTQNNGTQDVKVGLHSPGLNGTVLYSTLDSRTNALKSLVKIHPTKIGLETLCVNSGSLKADTLCYRVNVTTSTYYPHSKFEIPRFKAPTPPDHSIINCIQGTPCHVVVTTDLNLFTKNCTLFSGSTSAIVFRSLTNKSTCETDVLFNPSTTGAHEVCLHAGPQELLAGKIFFGERRCFTLKTATKDYCDPNPCTPTHGGKCALQPGETPPFQCVCPDTATGDRCQYQNPCRMSPCQNGGICESEDTSYKCQCPVGYIGQDCEVKIGPTTEPAFTDPSLQNGATIECKVGKKCVIPIFTNGPSAYLAVGPKDGALDVKITIPIKTLGQTINEALLEVTPNTPGSKKVCIKTDLNKTKSDDIRCYHIKTKDPGIIVLRTDSFISPSLPNGTTLKCSKKTQCHLIMHSKPDGSNCSQVIEGGVDQIDYHIFPTKLEGGSCVTDVVLEPMSTTGLQNFCLKLRDEDVTRCYKVDPDTSKPCVNKSCGYGGCIVEPDHSASCVCDDTHAGLFCEEIAPCKSSPCNNNGVCEQIGSTFKCHCSIGYQGDLCDNTTDVPSSSVPSFTNVMLPKGSTFICVKDKICKIPISVAKPDAPRPVVVPGPHDKGLMVIVSGQLSKNTDVPGRSDLYKGNIDVTPSETGDKRVCVTTGHTSVTRESNRDDTVCYHLHVIDTGSAPTDSFQEPTPAGGSEIRCRPHEDCHFLVHSKPKGGECPQVKASIGKANVFPSMKDVTFTDCITDISVSASELTGSANTICLKARTDSPERCLSIRPRPSTDPCGKRVCDDKTSTCILNRDNSASCVCNINSTSESCATTPAIQTGPTAPSTGTQERNDLDCSGGRMRIHVPQTLLPTHIVTLRDPSCKVASNGSHLLADVGVNECGTTVSFTNDSVIFTNELVATALSGTTAPTIIDYGMNMKDQRVKISCIYPRENRIDFSYVPVMKEAHFYERQYGKLSFDVSQYSDEQFSHAIPNNGLPIGVTLNTELFIDISLRHASHKGVGIMVDSCIATPTSSPADPLWYTVIKDGCPAQQDVRTFASPDVDEFRFSFLVFRFTQAPLQKAGPNLPPTSMVFIHCQVSACPSQNCTNTCNPAGSHRVRREAELENSHLVSAGPFYLKSEEERGGYNGGVVAASVSMAVVATLVAIVALVAWRRSVNKLSKHQTLDEAS